MAVLNHANFTISWVGCGANCLSKGAWEGDSIGSRPFNYRESRVESAFKMKLFDACGIDGNLSFRL